MTKWLLAACLLLFASQGCAEGDPNFYLLVDKGEMMRVIHGLSKLPGWEKTAALLFKDVRNEGRLCLVDGNVWMLWQRTLKGK